MSRKLKNIDFLFILVGLLSLVLGTKTILQTQTIILPAWFLAFMYGGILVVLSLVLGFMASTALKFKIHLVTISSLIISVVCLVYYFKEFRPTYKIIVPDKYSGEIKLFRSTLGENQLSLNKFGVGYITDKAYRKGFKPEVYQNGQDITKSCKKPVQGSVAFAGLNGSTIGPFSYVGFMIPGNLPDTIWTDLNKAIALKAMDTSVIFK
jgi:hypothetical protein